MTRPKKPIQLATGKLSKNEIAERKKQEGKLKLGRGDLIAPEWLTPEGQKEFTRVVEAAGYIDLLDNLDLGILAVYANAYAAYQEVTAQLQEEGYYEVRESRYDTYKSAHPLVSVQDRYVKQIMQCSSKLGLSTTDRLRLIVPEPDDDSSKNRYAKYL